MLVLTASGVVDMSFDISGLPGSADVTLTLSGSLEYVNQSTTDSQADETDFLRFPLTTSGNWFTPSTSWGGAELWNNLVAEQFLLTNSSDMMLSITGDFTQDYTFDSIYLRSGSDGFFIPYNSFVQGAYPVLANADLTFTVSGSASITLPDGLTFDNFNLGTRESGFAYQGNLVQTVSVIPEPSASILVASAAFLVVRRRRK